MDSSQKGGLDHKVASSTWPGGSGQTKTTKKEEVQTAFPTAYLTVKDGFTSKSSEKKAFEYSVGNLFGEFYDLDISEESLKNYNWSTRPSTFANLETDKEDFLPHRKKIQLDSQSTLALTLDEQPLKFKSTSKDPASLLSLTSSPRITIEHVPALIIDSKETKLTLPKSAKELRALDDLVIPVSHIVVVDAEPSEEVEFSDIIASTPLAEQTSGDYELTLAKLLPEKPLPEHTKRVVSKLFIDLSPQTTLASEVKDFDPNKPGAQSIHFKSRNKPDHVIFFTLLEVYKITQQEKGIVYVMKWTQSTTSIKDDKKD